MDRPLKDENDQDDEEAYEILGIMQMCKTFRTLPRAGGVLDQDAYFIYMYSHFEMALAERQVKDQTEARAKADADAAQAAARARMHR